jgi:Zn-dependent protease with chaperone function
MLNFNNEQEIKEWLDLNTVEIIDGIPIVLSDDVMSIISSNAFPNAFCTKNAFGYYIFINSLLMNISSSIREPILAHELGHIKSGHLDNITVDPDNIVGLNSLPAEMEADAYAASIYGPTLVQRALVGILRGVWADLDPTTQSNIENRLEALEALKFV